MQNLLDYTEELSTAVFLIGSPGSGKSTCALQFPKPYVFDADNNLGGPIRYLKSIGFDLSSVTFDRATKGEDGKPISPFMRYSHLARCLQKVATREDVETIVLDSLTTIQEIIKDDIFRQRVARPGSRVELITEANRDKAQLTEPEWGIYARYWQTLMTSLRQTNKIIVVTAHDETYRPDENSPAQMTLALQGQMRFKLAGLFSDVLIPVVEMKGFPPNQTQHRFYRTKPLMETDKRGVKDSFLMPPLFEDFGEYIKKVREAHNHK